MRKIRWCVVTGLCVCLPGVAAGGEDLASAFNKAFFDQLKDTNGNQAANPQVVEMNLMPANDAASSVNGKPSREAELDQQLQRMVSGPGYTLEFINEDAVPVPTEALRQLFPGPLQFDDSGGQAQPIREPDPLVMDMLSSMNNMVQEVVAPTLHKTMHASAAPDSCQKDAVAHCSTARSQVHCLGQHRDDISDDCRHDLGKSVPFVCSAAIDKHCDVLHVGILDCLQKYQDELSGDCKDAFLATSKAIKSLNSAAQVQQPRPASNTLAPPVIVATPATPQVVVATPATPQDQLIHDADHIEALLTQMSNKLTTAAKPVAVTGTGPVPDHGSRGPSFSMMLCLTILLLVAYFYFQSEAGRQVWLKLRMMFYGKPLLKRALDIPFGDDEVPL